MNVNHNQSQISLLDRLILIGKKIKYKKKVSNNCDLFVCKKKDIKLIFLKFSYLGNVQYHKITYNELDDLIDSLTAARNYTDF